MKTQNTLLPNTNNSNIDMKEVKETVATGSHLANAKTVFSSADLWNIQRMRKSRLAGRRQFA